jgi:hypothetical protein
VSVPTTAARSIEIAAPAADVYDVISDVTRTGEWSPECRSCQWLDTPGLVGSRFEGHNRRGLARWKTTARLLSAERSSTFSFATLHRAGLSTRWTYTIDGGTTTTLTESFEAISAPLVIHLAERFLIRKRQQQLEAGITTTLERIKAIVEAT